MHSTIFIPSMTVPFDLLDTVAQGGCSAKMAPGKLSELLQTIPLVKDARIMVDIETHDDAGVYRLNHDTALIVTTDFFPPVCSDPYTFGQIAAANSLSDVYAMGGTPLLCLNLTMFPSTSIPLEVLQQILLGGQNKITEAGAFTMGGHTLEDEPPKYGLAVVGTVNPNHLITNSGLKPGQKLILSKPLGTGVLMAAHKLAIHHHQSYQLALELMKQLNHKGAQTMQRVGVTGATDITGFGLLGHALKMAEASGVSLRIDSRSLPALPTALHLLANGCIPGAAFRNKQYAEPHVHVAADCSLELLYLACDAQTSGGLLMGVDAPLANEALERLHETYGQAAIVGEVLTPSGKKVYFT